MYCPNCGKKVDDNAAFCSSCGTKLSSNGAESKETRDNNIGSFFSKFTKKDQSQNYDMYEKFGPDILETAAKATFTPALLGFGAGKVLQKMVHGDNTVVESFVITDRSIIFKGNEYPSDCMTVISPEIGGSSKEVETSVNGEKIFLKYDKADKLRLYNAIIRLNTKINLASKRQMLRYLVTISLFLKDANEVIRTLPVSFDKDNKFDEFDYYNEPVMINAGAIVSEENQSLIANYTYAQKELNRFYKEVNPIEHGGYNRECSVLMELVRMMNESDDDIVAVINKRNEIIARKKEEEKRQEEEYQRRKAARAAGYYDDEDDGESFSDSLIKGVVGVAVGTALGNKISGNTGRKKDPGPRKKSYYATSGCIKTKRHTMSCSGCRMIPYCSDYR